MQTELLNTHFSDLLAVPARHLIEMKTKQQSAENNRCSSNTNGNAPCSSAVTELNARQVSQSILSTVVPGKMNILWGLRLLNLPSKQVICL